MSPIPEFEEDLAEIKSYQPYARLTCACRGKERIRELQYVLDNVDEAKMQEYRKNIKSLG